MRYRAQWRDLFVILDQLLSFYPSKHLENKNFENMKKMPEDIIILHMRTINDNHICFLRHEAWQNFLSFWAIFCPVTHNNPKNQNFEKMKIKIWRYFHFTYLHQKSWSYAILFLRYCTWQTFIFHSFWTIFCSFMLKKPRLKRWNNRKYHHFTNVYRKLWSHDIWFLRYGAPWTYEWTEKVKYRGWCHIWMKPLLFFSPTIVIQVLISDMTYMFCPFHNNMVQNFCKLRAWKYVLNSSFCIFILQGNYFGT